MKRSICLILLFFCINNLCFSQAKFVLQNKKGSDKVRFQLINNLIILPVEVNGVELSFLLDTGVSKPIIFNFLNVSDTLKIKDTQKIYLRGLGEGNVIEALKSSNNVFKIGDAIKINQDLYAVYDASLNFAPRLGVSVHGIMGYDLFKDFIVEVNYSSKYIKITNPQDYQYKDCKKCERFNLEFYNNKPYLRANVTINNKNIPVKLLIDTGGSDTLWLFEDISLGLVSSSKYFDDFLGHGLSGSVYGKRTKVDEFSLKSFKFKRANVAFPDSTSIFYAKKIQDRNGSLSGNVLKRFNIIFDYRKAIITLKKNNHYGEKFSYNKSGIELEHSGVRLVKEQDNSAFRFDNYGSENATGADTRIVVDTQYKLSLKPAYTIVQLRRGSPAERAGLMIGDIIYSVNNKSTIDLKLYEIVQKFYDDAGKRIKLRVERDGIILFYEFKLESPIN